MRKIPLFSAVLSLFLLVPASITWAQVTKTLNGTVRYESGMSKTTLATPNGNVLVNLPQSLSGSTITGTVSTEPTGKSEKEKNRNLKELLKMVVMLDGQKIPVSATPTTFDWLTHQDRQLRTPMELLNVSGQKIAEVSLPAVLPVPAVTNYGQAPHLYTLSSILVQGDLLNVYTDQQFKPGEKFILTDPSGQRHSLQPICLSAQQAVIGLPRNSVPGDRSIQEEVWNQPIYNFTIDKIDSGKVKFRLIGIELKSPNTNLHPGQKSFVMATVTVPDPSFTEGVLTGDFCIDLRNLNPQIVSMEGGNLQRIYASSGIANPPAIGSEMFMTITRNITGITPGTFSVSATLHEDYNTSNDPFRPQLNVLKTAGDFNDWAAALLKELKEYAAMQAFDVAGKATMSNAKRALDNMPVCSSADQLDECKAIASELLRPMNIPKTVAVGWHSSYEAGKIASRAIDQNLAGNSELIDWDVIRGGLKYIQNRGERLNDPGLKYGASNEMHVIYDFQKQGIEKSQLESLKERLEILYSLSTKKDSSEIWVHLDTGKYKSEYVPSDYKHMESGPAKSEYWPKWLKHAALEGPRESWYVPESYIHVDKGWDKSNYISPLVKHATEEGPDKSHYVADDWYHLKTGPSRSNYLPKTIRHIDTGANKSRIEYDVPGVDKPIREWEFQQKEKTPLTKTTYSLHNNFEAEKSSLYYPWKNTKPLGIGWDKEGTIVKTNKEYFQKPVFDSVRGVLLSPRPSGYYPYYFTEGSGADDYPDPNDPLGDPGPPRPPKPTKHIEDGPRKSQQVDIDWKHAEEGDSKSYYVPPDYLHAAIDGPDKSRYLDPDWKHASVDGPDKSKYQYKAKHVAEEGPEKSKYVNDYLKHVAEEGPDKSKYVNKDSDMHATEEGPDKSKYVSKNYNHETEGPGKSTYSTRWHRTAGPEKSKYESGPPWRHEKYSRYVPAWQ